MEKFVSLSMSEVMRREKHGLDAWLADRTVDIDEEMAFADVAIRRSADRDNALALYRLVLNELFEQAMRSKDEERLTEIATWMARDELCLDELVQLRQFGLRWSWETQAQHRDDPGESQDDNNLDDIPF